MEHLTHTSTAVVSEALTAAAMGSGDMSVFATPALVALMENAAMLCVRPLLKEGETTVGGQIDVKHLAPSRIGASVAATATLTAHEGRKLTFDITATEDDKTIGTASHTRFIVNREKFLA